MKEENKNMGRADMSAKVPTPTKDAMEMKPMVQSPKEIKVRSSEDQNLYSGGYVKKYAKGGGVRKVRY
tara:strand:+ start:2801 stop:3004 length:204 start_codon:yes stop_codon:yes gene_type:complete